MFTNEVFIAVCRMQNGSDFHQHDISQVEADPGKNWTVVSCAMFEEGFASKQSGLEWLH